MTREEAAILLKAELATMTFTEETKDRIQALYMAIKALEELPKRRKEAKRWKRKALKAEPVVRCKECKYWNSKTDLTHCYRLAWVGTEKDDYCSFSERREP